MKHLHIKEKPLNKSHQSLQQAGGEALKILGSYPIYVVHNEKLIETEVYFVKGATNLFLSLDICKRLCLVHEKFPRINVSETSLNTIANKVERLIPERPVDIPFPQLRKISPSWSISY